MAGRRRDYSGLATGLNLLSSGIVQDAEDRRKFNERLQEAGIKAGLESGQIAPQFQGGQFTGFGQGQQPLSVSEFQSQLAGIGGRGGQGGDGQFTTTITQDFDQFGRVKGFKVNRTEVKPKELSPTDQLRQSMIAAHGQLQQAQAAAPESFLPQAQGQLAQQLPQTPFVAGPGGGFITSQQPFEAMPESLIPRSQVIGGLAPGLTPQLRQQGIQAAQGQVAGLQGIASGLNQAGLLGTPGSVVEDQLPDPTLYNEGDVVEDDATGQRYRKVNGQWQPS